MKVLLCTPRFPYPPLRGDQSIGYERLKYLSARYEVVLLSFYESSEDLQNLEQVQKYCSEVHLVRLPKWRSVMNMGLGLLNPDVPLQVAYYQSANYQRKLHGLLDRHKIDVLHVVLLRLAPYFLHLKTPKVIELIDSMILNLERRLEKRSGPVRWLLAEELRRVRRFEQEVAGGFDAAVVVSEIDKRVLGDEAVEVIPIGVNTNLFKPSHRVKACSLVFSGNMSYEPNILAVKWFVHNCLESVRAAMPDVELVISGTDPSREVLELARHSGVIVTGRVPSMVDVLNKAMVAVAPMQTGSGMQFKILEAMSCSLPVVTTSLGLGGIRATPDKELLVADTPEGFSQAVVALLKTASLREQIGSAAREFVVQNHSWDAVCSRLDPIYRRIAKKAEGME